MLLEENSILKQKKQQFLDRYSCSSSFRWITNLTSLYISIIITFMNIPSALGNNSLLPYSVIITFVLLFFVTKRILLIGAYSIQKHLLYCSPEKRPKTCGDKL